MEKGKICGLVQNSMAHEKLWALKSLKVHSWRFSFTQEEEAG